MSIIEFRDITKKYRRHFWTRQTTAVNSLSFTIQPRTIAGFVGPNGAGKTTSIKILLGLLFPTSGTAFINGDTVLSARARAHIAYIPEQPCFYEHLTVEESLAFLCKLRHLPRHAMKSEISRVLEKVELTETRTKRIQHLSKGMRQRLNMAQALLGNASLFLLDEPMSGLDPPGRSLFRSIIRDLASSGKTVFFSTHILDDIETLCEDVVVLSRGNLVYHGAVAALLEKGFKGTELTIPNPGENLCAALAEHGYSINRNEHGITVFVPTDGDVAQAEHFIFQHNAYCSSVIRKHESLETVLYRNPETLSSMN